MLEISNNSTSIYRTCPKKYYWTYIKGLTPYKKSPALVMGSILHSAFDMFYKKFSEEEVAKYIGKACDEEIANASPDTSEEYVLMKYTLLGMWLNYPKDLSCFSKIQSEFELKISFSDGIVLVLKLDGLVVKDNLLWIRELKSTGMTFPQFEQRTRTSAQASLYTYAVRRAGYPVQGVIYDFVKKPQLRKGMHEDKDQFGQRIMQSYKEKPDMYYKRHYTYRTDEDLALFEKDLMITTADILRSCKTGDFCRNQDSCWSFNSSCPFLPICFQKEPDQLTIEVFFIQQPTINKGAK